MRKASLWSAIFACFLTVCLVSAASAQQRISFIRDAEIEDTIRVISTPIFRQAGLLPEAVDVYLIDDKSLNAFVAGGQNMFLHTGFLMATDDIGEVIGVIAHETGHIEGGHIAARKATIDDLQAPLWATYALGLGAAILSGDARVGAAAAAASQNAILRDLLLYTRGQEASADQAALRLLEGAGYNPTGLLTFMSKLQGQEALLSQNQDPYLRSHPLTTDRMNYLRDFVASSRYSSTPFPEDLRERHQRMQAKLFGFMASDNEVLNRYPMDDNSLPARYARAIMDYRRGRIDKALEQIDALIADNPEDPYFYELKGQVLYENGRIAEAVDPYRRSVQHAPDSALLKLAYAQTLVQADNPATFDEAKKLLQEALQVEESNATAWRQIAIIEGKQGNLGQAALALAETALARGNPRDIRDQAVRALSLLEEGTADHLRADDLKRYAESELQRRAQ